MDDRSRRTGLALVTAAAVTNGITYADHAPLIPLIAADLLLSDVQIGLLSTALFFVSMAVGLSTSGLADRVGPNRTVLLGITASLVGSLVLAVAPSYGVLLVGKGLEGVGSGLTFVAGARYVAGLYAGARSHLGLGLYGAGYPLGSAAAVLTLPTLAGLVGSWRGALGVSAVAIAVITIGWLFAPAVRRVASAGTVRDAFRNGNAWLTALQHSAGFGLAITSGTWISVFLVREFSLPLALSGLLGSLLLLVMVLARPFGGFLLSREHIPTRTLMRAGTLIVMAGVLLLAIPGRPLLIELAGALVLGAGVGLPYAAVFNTAAASVRRAPGSGQALAAAGGTVGVMLGAPAMGLAVQTLGFWAAWLFVGVVAAAALAGTAFIRGEEELV